MSLPSGTRLGPYELIALLGAGGMGEVYRARDSQLKREVALKTLPSGVTGDAERLARFQREAEVLAALNHPNIAQIHGLADGLVSGVAVRALVMELVDGEDLSRRIAAGPVPIPEALTIARQIALALDYAHERGIVHRDLKPANIKVTPDGHVKVLDFGLAKAMEQGSGIGDHQGSGGAANSPTITSPAMTERGMILGTAAYMSPEQAKGKLVDKRSDIWAFGCVLFETITGKRTFDGEDVTDSIVAVMSRDPSWQALPSATPPAIRKLLRRCLEKDRSKRLADIRDALFEIDDAIANPVGSVESPPPSGSRVSRRDRARWMTTGAAIAAIVMATLVLTGVLGRGGTHDVPTLDLSFFHTEGSDVGEPSLSPDGRKVAYRARRADGMPMIWVRDLATGATTSLAGTEDGWHPFWSPDSQHIGFQALTALKRVPAGGGPVQLITTLVDQVAGLGASWFGDTILFASLDNRPLMVVSATGGSATEVTTLSVGDAEHLWPSFLPDGRRFLFTLKVFSSASEAGAQGIYLGSLDNREVRRLLPDLSSAVYAPEGFIIFARGGKTAAVAFNLQSGTVAGEPTVLDASVVSDSQFHLAGVSVSTAGAILAVRPPPANLLSTPSGLSQSVLVDRGGQRAVIGPTADVYGVPWVSDDGSRMLSAVTAADGTVDVHEFNLRSGVRTPVTSTRAWAAFPVPSPDRRRVAFAYQGAGMRDDIHVKDLTTGQVIPLVESKDAYEHPLAWSNDGRSLLFEVFPSYAIKIASLPSGATVDFADGRYAAAFSPDDRYVAYASGASGRFETLVTTFPDRRQTWPLTTEGGQVISWRADGREILVATLSGHIAAYPVTTGPAGFSAGPPAILVRDVGLLARNSSATPDHSRILIRTNPDAAKDRGEIRLLFNWTSRLSGAKR